MLAGPCGIEVLAVRFALQVKSVDEVRPEVPLVPPVAPKHHDATGRIRADVDVTGAIHRCPAMNGPQRLMIRLGWEVVGGPGEGGAALGEPQQRGAKTEKDER